MSSMFKLWQPSGVKWKRFGVWPLRGRLRERYCPLVEAMEPAFGGSRGRIFISKGKRTQNKGKVWSTIQYSQLS